MKAKISKNVLLVGALVLSMCLLAGCGKKEEDLVVAEEPIPTEVVNENQEDESTEQAGENENADESAKKAADEEADTEFTFADVADWGFWFGSGAGAWSTELSVYEDGSFEGLYHDSDMGSMDETYPEGTVYVCNFKGKFTQPERVNEYTYSVKIESIELENEPETEELGDGRRYVYTDPYGLEDAEEILIYLPGAPIAELPEEFLSWMNAYDLTDTLPFYGLYNVVPQNGFSSFEHLENGSIDDELVAIEEEANALASKLQAEDVTQADMNITSGDIYCLWDDELNAIWNRLTEKLDEDTMATLLEEQREWIAYKESEITAASADYEGGSMQGVVANDKAAELTKARVYELAEWLR